MENFRYANYSNFSLKVCMQICCNFSESTPGAIFSEIVDLKDSKISLKKIDIGVWFYFHLSIKNLNCKIKALLKLILGYSFKFSLFSIYLKKTDFNQEIHLLGLIVNKNFQT